jgi:hypothetical protein
MKGKEKILSVSSQNNTQINKIKEDETRGACSTHVGGEIQII